MNFCQSVPHGKTQKANEALNNIIWSKCPKNVYLDRPVLELGVYSAVLSYNDGNLGLKDVLGCFDLQMGHCSLQFSTKRVNFFLKGALPISC